MPILTETIEIKVTKKNINHLLEQGYNVKLKDFVLVKPNDLTPYSNKFVQCQCDFCGAIFSKRYAHVPKEGPINCKNPKCVYERQKYTLMNNYGVTNVFQMEKTKNSIKKTNLERYGDTCTLRNKGVQEKIKKTNLERYGAEHPLAKESILYEKRNQTVRDKYGVDNVFQDPSVKEKIKASLLEHHGGENPMQCPDIREKIEQSNLDHYRVKNVFQAPEIKEKIKNYNLEHYNVEHVMQRKDIQEKARQSYKNNETHREASDEQIHLNSILNGVLNYKVNHRKGAYVLLDIAFPQDMFYIECDFGGHFVWHKIKKHTEQEMYINDQKRDSYLHNLGWKNMRFLSRKDKMFDDNKMIKLVDKIKALLLSSDDNRCICDYDNNNIVFEPSMKTMNLNEFLEEEI